MPVRTARPGYGYIMPKAVCLGNDVAANLAFFLLQNTGSVFERFRGRLHPDDQRILTGEYFGDDEFTINGAQGTFQMADVIKRWHELRGKPTEPAIECPPVAKTPTGDDARLIAWAEAHPALDLGVQFQKSRVKVGTRTFNSIEAALEWATDFSKNFGFKVP